MSVHNLMVRLRQYSRCAMTGEELRSTKHQPNKSLDYILKGRVYIEEVPPDIEPIKRLLEKYSGIRPKDIDEHIYQIVRITCHYWQTSPIIP